MYSLTSFFTVPKGDSDVRLVYNGTKSGLNDCHWAPWLRLPKIEQHSWSVEPGTYMANMDIAEMFLNYILHEEYAGVDLTAYFANELDKGTRKWKQTMIWK